MAALARSSASSASSLEARLPCPYCGGLVHPIAGRCKHCKQDLVSQRSRSGQAGAPLPALAPLPGAAARVVALPAVAAMAEAERSRGLLRSWTFWVIVLALGAMLAALVLLLWPQHAPGARRGKAPIERDRMDTEALPERGGSSGGDPWSSPSPGAGPSSRAPTPDRGVSPPSVDDPTPLDPVPPDPLDDPPTAGADPSADPLADLDADPDPDLGAPGTAPGPATPERLFYSQLVRRLCRRMSSCGQVDPTIAVLCTALPNNLPPMPMPCFEPAAAAACLRAVDHVPCSGQASASLFRDLPACLALFRC